MKVTIFEKNMNNELWPEIIHTMTYIKNNCLTKAFLSNVTLHKA